MMKQTKNRVKWLGLTVLLGLILWFAYDLHFKYLINDYQARQIEKRLQQNFHDNRDSFNELLTFSRQLSTIKSLEFRENGQIYFQIYDTIQDRKAFDNDFISIGNNSSTEVLDIQFKGNNTILVISEDQDFLSKSWIIDYEGDIGNPIVEKLLSYNNISLEQLKELDKKLDKANCQGLDKNDSLITIQFVGHWGESFNYLFPLTNKSDSKQWHKLEDNYYWEHYQNGLFCGWTDW
ncbi:hypothetical protein [Owenweeksia hongkongensis]|uniref:hypothetical protein n=1 Tax=Owenweeksia hongkongensis TaxID=253245 RepID=UPI003A93E162